MGGGAFDGDVGDLADTQHLDLAQLPDRFGRPDVQDLQSPRGGCDGVDAIILNGTGSREIVFAYLDGFRRIADVKNHRRRRPDEQFRAGNLDIVISAGIVIGPNLPDVGEVRNVENLNAIWVGNEHRVSRSLDTIKVVVFAFPCCQNNRPVGLADIQHLHAKMVLSHISPAPGHGDV